MAYFKIIYRNVLGMAEENHEKLHEVYPGRDSNPEPPEYKEKYC
jgi:hypothetical protein